jgi:hypothetical protein
MTANQEKGVSPAMACFVDNLHPNGADGKNLTFFVDSLRVTDDNDRQIIRVV